MTTLTAKDDAPKESPPRILYREGFKYQLQQDYTVQTRIHPAHDIVTPFIHLTAKGLLTVKYGYAWDGASGPTRDTKSSMRGSLVHDALYQLMRMKVLELRWRGTADRLFYFVISADRMLGFRAWWWHRSVRRWAEKGASGPDRTVLVAP